MFSVKPMPPISSEMRELPTPLNIPEIVPARKNAGKLKQTIDRYSRAYFST
jgi:hypothetical protein